MKYKRPYNSFVNDEIVVLVAKRALSIINVLITSGEIWVFSFYILWPVFKPLRFGWANLKVVLT